VAAHGEIEDFTSNPASLTSLSIPQLFISHHESLLESNYEMLAFGFPFKNQGLAFSTQFIDAGSAERVEIDSSNAPVLGLGNVQWSTFIFQTAWAREWGQKLSLGATAKGWRTRMDDSSSTSWAGDLGIQVRSLLPSLDLGLAYRNLGPAEDGFSPPDTLGVGLAYHFFKSNGMKRTTLFSELDFASYRDLGSRVGIEIHRNLFWLRGGYENLTPDLNDNLSQFSFGMGLRIKGWKVDYAWVPKGDLGDQHRVGIKIGFGLTPEDRLRAAKELDQAMENRSKSKAQNYYSKGMTALKEGNAEFAVQSFSKSLTWDPEFKFAQTSLHEAQEKLKQEKAQTHYQMGIKQAQNERWLDAAFHYQQCLNLSPHHKKAQISLKTAQGKIIQNAIPKSRENAMDDVFREGVHHYLMGQYDTALTQWKKVEKADPNWPHLREYMEKAKNKKLEEKMASLEKSNQTNKDQADILAQKAYTFYRLGQMDKAILTWEKALVFEPENKETRLALKEARERKKLMQGTLQDNKAQRITELNAGAVVAYDQGNFEQAISIWKKALLLEPHNRRIKNNLKRVKAEMTRITGGPTP